MSPDSCPLNWRSQSDEHEHEKASRCYPRCWPRRHRTAANAIAEAHVNCFTLPCTNATATEHRIVPDYAAATGLDGPPQVLLPAVLEAAIVLHVSR